MSEPIRKLQRITTSEPTNMGSSSNNEEAEVEDLEVTALTDALQERLRFDSNLVDIERLENRLQNLHLDAVVARDRLASLSEYYRQPLWKRAARPGDQMLASLFRCLAAFDQTKFRRSPAQMEMHVIMTQACLRQIYGSEYLSKEPDLLRRFGVSTFRSLVAIFATRRFGKTFALAQFIAAFMWTQERSVINVFSLSRRASKSMVDKILMMLDVLLTHGMKLEIKTKNEEVLTIVNPMGICSTVYSYPCSEIRFMSTIYIYVYVYVCVCPWTRKRTKKTGVRLGVLPIQKKINKQRYSYPLKSVFLYLLRKKGWKNRINARMLCFTFGSTR